MLFKRDVTENWANFRRAHDPQATPEASSFGGELLRNFNIGKNNGELAVEAGSVVAGPLALKALGRAGAAGRALSAAKLAEMGLPEVMIPRWMEPYNGMGHHNFRRSWGKQFGASREFVNDPTLVYKPTNGTFGEFQRDHFGLDDGFFGGSSRGGRWSGRELGMRRFTLPERLWIGTPTPTKAAIGAGAAIGIASAEQAREK